MGQQPRPPAQQPGLQQQYIQQFPGQQVHGVITSQHAQVNNSNQQRPQFQYSQQQPPQQQQQGNYQDMIPISQVQEMIPIPQVQPINTNVSLSYFVFRESNKLFNNQINDNLLFF